MEISKLDMVSTQELLDEITKRFDCSIFLGTQTSDKHGDITHKVEGNLLGVLGLFRLGEFYTLMKIDELYSDDITDEKDL